MARAIREDRVPSAPSVSTGTIVRHEIVTTLGSFSLVQILPAPHTAVASFRSCSVAKFNVTKNDFSYKSLNDPDFGRR